VAGQVLVVMAAALGAGALARTFGRQVGSATEAPAAENPGGPDGLPPWDGAEPGESSRTPAPGAF